MTNKVRICFVLPLELQHDLKKQLVEDGYTFKEKSRWVAESVERLLSISNYVDLVKVNDEMAGFGESESIMVEKFLKIKIDQSIIDVRRKYPDLEGVQSKILRTAILQRILIGYSSVTEFFVTI